MNQSYDTTTPEGKSQVIEAYREAIKSEAGLSLKAFCDRLGLSDESYRDLLPDKWTKECGLLKSPEETAPEVRNAPNRGRRRTSARLRSPKGMNKHTF